MSVAVQKMLAIHIVLSVVPLSISYIQRAPPIDADPRRNPGFSDLFIFRKMWIVDFFPMVFGVLEGLQSIGNGCGLQIDGFSAHIEPYESIFEDFHDLDHGGLTLVPNSP